MLVDTDDLIDSSEVADILGLTNHRSVSVYRRRYPDFPQPVIEKKATQCTLWWRPDVVAYARRRSEGRIRDIKRID